MVMDEASAVPGFARQNQMQCSNCHTTWSQLTEYGRQFKEAGYTGTGPTQDISDNLSWAQTLPISGRLNMRLVDMRHSKTTTNDKITDKDKQIKMRAMHEFELFFAGMLSENFSFFAEIEGEDEGKVNVGHDRGFDMWFAMGAVGFHPKPEANIHLGWGSPYFADPYNTLHARGTNRYGRVIDGFLPGDTQFASFSGRYQNLFYLAAVHDHPDAGALDLEGHDPYDVSFRAAYDVVAEDDGMPHVAVGGFFTRTHATHYKADKSKDTGFDWNLFGGDVQVDYQGAHLNVIIASAQDSVDSDGDGIGDKTTSDYCFTVEGHYFMIEDDAPVFGPSIIFEKYTESDGKDDWARLGVFATYFARENVKAQIGWEGDVSAPAAYKNKEGRITVVLDLGF